MPQMPPTFDDVRAAHARIAPLIHRTPVLRSAALDALTGLHLHFKCENFQKIGAFKARGATNAVLQ
ncbi:MAG: pyridoxal-phosphate dependent enzyme, partial [Catalinimonas sp.]